MRSGLEQAIKELQDDLMRMGSLVEEAIDKAVRSLADGDKELAQEVIAADDLVDALEREIDAKCMTLIARQQPLAKDLRTIGAAMKIVTDLERMADHASDIAKVTIRLDGEPLIKPLVDIPRMATLTQMMVKNALDAYIREDIQLAEEIGKADDEVDHLYSQIFRELLLFMLQDPRTINQATYLIFVGRYLERIGDHATNIGERVVYLVTGKNKDLNI